MMDQKKKNGLSDPNSSPEKKLESSWKSSRRQARARVPGRMPADMLAKLIIAGVTALLLLGLLISFLVPSSRKPGPKKSSVKSYGEKLEYARTKRREGKDLIRKSYNSDSAKVRNKLLKQAEEILWESKEAYSEILDAHDDGDGNYGYLQREIEGVQTNIYYCQKTRTITEFD